MEQGETLDSIGHDRAEGRGGGAPVENRGAVFSEEIPTASAHANDCPDYPRWFAVCGVTFVVLVGWMWLFQYSGDADAIGHYQTARDTLVDPSSALGPWARPLHKLLILWPASLGHVPARIAQALITILVMWQTMRLAQSLKFPRPWMAGLFLIWQPYVFQLGSDTMTELPFALGMLIAVRLWRARWIAMSSMLVGFLPMVRPEGFILGALWGVMLLATPALGPTLKRMALGLPGVIGLLSWSMACHLITGNWRYFLDIWSWPPGGWAAYSSGPLLYHVYMWPDYCGLILLPLFLLGIRASVHRPGMGLPWWIWLAVFVGHSIMYWGHWFASIGLMRIMVTTAPVSALVCHEGWRVASGWLRPRVAERNWRRIGWAIAALASVYVGARYYVEPEHHQCFPLCSVVRVVKARGLDRSAPMLFAADPTFYAELGLPGKSKNAVTHFQLDRKQVIGILEGLPVGSVGVWDNRMSEVWFGVKTAEIPSMGYEVLHQEVYLAPYLANWFGAIVPAEWRWKIQYTLLRKVR